VSVGPRSDAEGGSDTHREFMALADVALLGSYRTAAYVLGDRNEAEDAVQEALVLAWRAWPRLRDVTRFEAWFDRILVNVCYERLRGRKRAPSEPLSPDVVVPARDSFASAIARDAVAQALHKLTPEQRIVVVLRYWRDLSIEEIAERVRIPSGTVRSRLHYALRTLRSELDDDTARSLEVQP
jgi:RNA polymerase sigma-70 factor, ECF subfamily